MTTAPRDPQMLKGILPVLVIALLTERESYGYELVTRLQHTGLEDIAAGTVYPVLTRLEREGHISSRLVASSSGPARKYYLPTPAGSEHLERSAADWRRLARTVETVLARIAPATPMSASTPSSAGTPPSDAVPPRSAAPASAAPAPAAPATEEPS